MKKNESVIDDRLITEVKYNYETLKYNSLKVESRIHCISESNVVSKLATYINAYLSILSIERVNIMFILFSIFKGNIKLGELLFNRSVVATCFVQKYDFITVISRFC